MSDTHTKQGNLLKLLKRKPSPVSGLSRESMPGKAAADRRNS